MSDGSDGYPERLLRSLTADMVLTDEQFAAALAELKRTGNVAGVLLSLKPSLEPTVERPGFE